MQTHSSHKSFKQLYKKPVGKSWPIYKRLLSYGKTYWVAFVIAVVANAVYSGLDSLFVYLLKPLLDEGFVNPAVKFVKMVPLIAIGLFTLRCVASLIGSYSITYVGRSVVLRFRQEIFQKLMHLPCNMYDQSSSGQLLTMLTYNSSQVAAACTDAVTTLIQSASLIIGLITVMFVISWKISLLFFILFPLMAVLFRVSSRRLRKLNHHVQNTMSELTHTAEEAIGGYKVIRTFGQEKHEIKKFNKIAKSNFSRELKIVMTKTLSTSAIQLIGVAGLAGMIYIGTSAALQETLTAGGFTALLGAMMALLKPLKDLTAINATIQRGLAGAESIFAFIDTEEERDKGTLCVDRVKGLVEFKHVSFYYHSTNKAVLEDISIKIEPGETVAIVGRSGAGKSTFVNLIPRFYDYQHGMITIDGINICELSLHALRTQIAIVSQHVTLFNDTIRNNIKYGKIDKNIDEQLIIEAARSAHALEFVEQLPDGLNTMIGENGVLLSGGQRQRIAIARAILKDAPILILDEATSALDTESERLIQDALETIKKNRTTFVIAHRLSTIENADKIILLDKGRIVEWGTHASLLQRKGHYNKLHQMQFREPTEIVLDAQMA